jgi:hypothetical protein
MGLNKHWGYLLLLLLVIFGVGNVCDGYLLMASCLLNSASKDSESGFKYESFNVLLLLMQLL